MPSTLFTSPRSRQLTSSGAVLPGCKLYFYVSGTLTAATTYQNAGLTVAHANPVLADTGGLFPAIWLDNSVSYDVTLKTSTGSTVWSVSAISGAVTDILILTSQATAEPFSSTYIEFQEPDESRKGIVGFLSSATNVFYNYSYRAAKMIFGTGNAAEDAAVFRGSWGGTDTSTVFELICQGASSLGGGVIKFVLGGTSTVKAALGFASEADNDFDITNAVSGGHIEFSTSGTGRIRVPLASGSASAPMISVTGDTNTGIYSAGADQLNFTTGGTARLSLTSAVATFAVRADVTSTDGIRFVTGSSQIYEGNNTDITLAPSGTVVAAARATGSFKFQPKAAPTGTPENGDVYYDSDTDKLMVYAAGIWVALH